jgi:hypothetical protein
MTPDDLALVQRSWAELAAHRDLFAVRFTAELSARRGPSAGPVHAGHLLAAADELVELLVTPSRLAHRAAELAASWGPAAATPSVADGEAWVRAGRASDPSWSPAVATAWRRAWLLLSDVLAEVTLTPFAGAPCPRSTRT